MPDFLETWIKHTVLYDTFAVVPLQEVAVQPVGDGSASKAPQRCLEIRPTPAGMKGLPLQAGREWQQLP